MSACDSESRQPVKREGPEPLKLDGEPGEITATHKAIAQRALASVGLWESFNEAKERRRRALRDAGHDRDFANSEAWRELLDTWSQDEGAFRKIGISDFWRLQYYWLRRLVDTIEEPLLKEGDAQTVVREILADCEELSNELVPESLRELIVQSMSPLLYLPGTHL